MFGFSAAQGSGTTSLGAGPLTDAILLFLFNGALYSLRQIVRCRLTASRFAEHPCGGAARPAKTSIA